MPITEKRALNDILRHAAGFAALVLVLSGTVPGHCATERSVQKGDRIAHPKGFYQFTVPDENYRLIEYTNGLGMVLTPEESFAGKKGNYAVNLFPQSALPAEAQSDPQKAFDWLRENLIEKKAKKAISVVRAEALKFQEEDALRVEYYLPGDFQERASGMLSIKRPPYGYVAHVFYHNGYLYWVYHADPIDQYRSQEPHVEDIAREEYEIFAGSLSLEPKKA
jgi:hypothetical protein